MPDVVAMPKAERTKNVPLVLQSSFRLLQLSQREG